MSSSRRGVNARREWQRLLLEFLLVTRTTSLLLFTYGGRAVLVILATGEHRSETSRLIVRTLDTRRGERIGINAPIARPIPVSYTHLTLPTIYSV